MKALLFVAFVAFVAYVYSDNPLKPTCPEEMDRVTLIPHPCNCSTYFVCVSEPPIPMPCPPGLHFDRKTEKCDYKWIAKCKPDSACPKTS